MKKGVFHWYIEVDVRFLKTDNKCKKNVAYFAVTFIPVILEVIFTYIFIWTVLRKLFDKYYPY